MPGRCAAGPSCRSAVEPSASLAEREYWNLKNNTSVWLFVGCFIPCLTLFPPPKWRGSVYGFLDFTRHPLDCYCRLLKGKREIIHCLSVTTFVIDHFVLFHVLKAFWRPSCCYCVEESRTRTRCRVTFQSTTRRYSEAEHQAELLVGQSPFSPFSIGFDPIGSATRSVAVTFVRPLWFIDTRVRSSPPVDGPSINDSFMTMTKRPADQDTRGRRTAHRYIRAPI